MGSAVVRIGSVTAVLLLVPLVAMGFTDQVTWSPGDFVVAGWLLSGAGLAYHAANRKGRSATGRAAIGAAIGTVALLLWANMAVGLL